MDRPTLVRMLAHLSSSDFELLVTMIPKAAGQVSRHGTIAEKTAELIHWAETPMGCGLPDVERVLAGLVGPPGGKGRTPPGCPTPTDGLGRLDLVPDLPRHLLPRPDEVDACREKLLGPSPGTVAITAPHKAALAVRGMGGAGKSVLANAVARDERVRKHFTGGIFWVTVGQDNAGTEAKATALQTTLAARLGSPLSVVTVQEGRQHLRTLLADRVCLVVLDDVWETVDAQRMDVVESPSPSRILLTTREGRVVTDLDAVEVRLGQLPVDQAVALLSDWSGTSIVGNTNAWAVARECGYLPLALAICGAMARDGASWADIASGLRQADLSFLRRRGIDPTYESVLKSIAASVNYLDATEPETARHYRDLAVFPPDQPVPEAVVAMVWAESAGCQPYQAGIDLTLLERKSLVTIQGVAPRRSILLHDLQHDYLRGVHPDLARASTQVLNAYRRCSPGGWATGPDDGYFFQHLTYHLTEAGRDDELKALLLDVSWLEAKLRATGVIPLIGDYKPFAGDKVLTLVRWALRLSANHLAREPSLLRSQLHGRLMGTDLPEIQGLLAGTAGPRPCLRLLRPSLTSPGGELIQSLEGHDQRLTAVAVTPDGTRAVSASGDRTLKVWDLATGAPLHSLVGHSGWVEAVAVTPDGTRAVSASGDRTLKVWDLATGAPLRSLVGHADPVTAVAVTPDGTRAVSASGDYTLKVWDLLNGALLRSLEGHAYMIFALAVTPGGTRAVSGSEDRTLKVWDLDTGAPLHSLVGHAGPVTAVAVTPDGRHAVSASDDHTLKVWDLDTGTLLRSLEGHGSWVHAVAVTPDGRHAVSASLDRTLKVWDLDTERPPRPVVGHAGPVTAVAVTPDGTRAVSGSEDRTLKVWDLDTGAPPRSLEGHAGPVTAVAVTPDGTRAVSASGDYTFKVWDLGRGRLLRSLEDDAGPVTAVAVTPDGTRAVSASGGRTLKVWDLDTGAPPRSLEGHAGPVTAVAVTPDGTRAVSASGDYTLRVWDLDTRTLLRSLEGHAGPVTVVAVTPDGTRAVSASGGRTLNVWDLDTGAPPRSLKGHAGPVTAVAVTPDGTRAVSGSEDRTLKVWDLDTRTLLRSLEGHAGPVTAVAVTPDGRHAVSVSEDKALKVWDLTTGTPLATFAADYPLSCCGVSPSGGTFVVADQGGRVHFLRLENL
jgi:WD40 repeat protein